MRFGGLRTSVLVVCWLVLAGCSSTTAPPVVPAPDPQKPGPSQTEKAVAEINSPKPQENAVTQATPQSGQSATAAPTGGDAADTQELSAVVDAEKSVANKDKKQPADADPETSKNDSPPSAADPANVGTVGAIEVKPEAKPSRADMVRLVAFAPAGPLVMDIAVYLDGQSLGKVRTEAIDRIFDLIDEDHDGRISWEQFVKHPRVKSGLYGNAAIADGANLDDLLEKYDVVKNDRVDKDELPRFFSDDRGATKAFSLLAPARPVGSPGEHSLILKWLDLDGDGQLSAEELTEARAQLRIRDADDDRVLSASELMPQADVQMNGMMASRKPSSGPPAGMLIGPNPRWEALSYYMEEIYAGAGKKLRTSHLTGTEELAKRLDGNKDGRISSIELQNFENVPADLTCICRYVSRATKDGPQSTMEAAPLAGDWAKYQTAWKQDGPRAQLSADEFSISFSMSDLVGVAVGIDFVKPQFDQLDADKNGYLEEKEFIAPQVAAGLTFDQVDENKDGKVYLEEIEKITSERQIVAGTQAVIKVEITGDPFQSVLDRDGDGRLSDREIREVEKNLTALDKDGDGLVGIGELPQSMKISVIRGIVAEGQVVPDAPVMTTFAGNSDAPLWFSKMDANGDGELNEIEFIGTPEQFAMLDKDRDGAIVTSELPTQPKSASDAAETNPAPPAAATEKPPVETRESPSS